MLILRRKEGETLLIGDDIKIMVLDTSDGGVRLAIEAPKEISILRGELVRAMDANRDAANEEAKPQELQALLNVLEKPETKKGDS